MATAPERAWQEIEETELAAPGVASGTGFGRNVGLKIGGKVFAIRTADAVVVKLPAARIAALLAAGAAERWGPGKRVMNEWVAIPDREAGRWAELVAESRNYVAR